jgi:hypothetical protein
MKHREEEARLLEAIKAMLPKLEAILAQTEEPWGCEDGVYRFYHQSFKVYGLQRLTKDVVEALQAIAPERKLDAWFLEIMNEGTNRTFSTVHNQRWLQETRPIVEAFFHAHYMLSMICKYGRELESPPKLLPSGWAAVLSLYGMR